MLAVALTPNYYFEGKCISFIHVLYWLVVSKCLQSSMQTTGDKHASDRNNHKEVFGAQSYFTKQMLAASSNRSPTSLGILVFDVQTAVKPCAHVRKKILYL